MRTVSIVVPAYNEEKRISPMLEEYSKYFEEKRKNGEIEYELLVVINNTTDRTEEIVRAYQRMNKRIAYINLKPGGKGFATIQGFKEALRGRWDLIGFVDADMSTLPKDFYDLIENIGSFGGIIASRYMAGAIIDPKPTRARLFAKGLFNAFTRALLFLPYRDTQCGAKLFKREAVERLIPRLTMSRWAFDVELLYNLGALGFRVREFPTIWSDKAYATINFWQAGPWMALAIIRLRILNSPFRRFVKVYDKFLRFVPK